MTVRVVTAPASPLVSLTDAKLMLRVDHALDDALITALVAAATMEAQQTAARAFVTQTLQLTRVCWPDDGVLRLDWPPVQSVTWVKYYDSDNVLQTVNAADYVTILDEEPALIVPASGKSWPTDLRSFSAVRVQYVAGYGTPAQAVVAQPDLAPMIMALVAVDYEHRDQISSQAEVQRERLLNGIKKYWGWAE